MRTFVVGLLLVSFHMDAVAQTKVVAVEGWSDPLSVEASAFLDRMVLAFKARGFVGAPRSGITLEEAQRLLESGHTLFSENKQKQAAKVLGELVTKLREPPADPNEADELLAKQMPALVLLSQASFRLRDKKGGVERLEMVERQFPDMAIPYDDLGPESVERRPKIARRLARRRKASLTMRALPHGVLMLDGRKVGFGEATLRLHSGTYAAFARMGDAKSGVAWVKIKPGENKSVALAIPQGEQFARTFHSSEVVLLSVWGNRVLKGVLYRNGIKIRQHRIKIGGVNSFGRFVDTLIKPQDEVVLASPKTTVWVDQEAIRKKEKKQWVDTILLTSMAAIASGFVGVVGAALDKEHEGQWLVGGLSVTALGTAVFFGTLIVNW